MEEHSKIAEKRKLFHSIWFPLLFIAVLWTIKTYEIVTYTSLSHFGLYPLTAKGLIGIVTSPLLHASWEHLANNSPSLFILLWAVFYFYKEVSWKVFFLTWFMNGFWLWFFGRDSYHIGASGLIYGFGAFIFFSGIIRMNRNLIAISMLVAFLYGSMVWGIFPLKEKVSWESHLTGMMAGVVLSIYYKAYGPQQNIFIRKSYTEDDEDNIGEDDEFLMEAFEKYEQERKEKSEQNKK